MVFHTQVRRFDEFITVFIKRVGAIPIFKTMDHWFYLFKLFFCFFEVIIQYPESQVEYTFFTLERIVPVYIFTDVWNDVVVVDRVGDLPTISGQAV